MDFDPINMLVRLTTRVMFQVGKLIGTDIQIIFRRSIEWKNRPPQPGRPTRELIKQEADNTTREEECKRRVNIFIRACGYMA